jgi:penicillin-binding protein 2
MRFFRSRSKVDISYDEILLDSSNLPSWNTGRLEGRMEMPLQKRSIYFVGAIFVIVASVFFAQLFKLQIIEGAELATRSELNRLEQGVIIAERGVIFDRRGELVAWNERNQNGEYDFPVRAYTDRQGLGQLIGYVSYPKKDTAGFYYRTDYVGRDGVEGAYDEVLDGENGTRLIEVNVHGEVISEHAVEAAQPGIGLTLSIDAELSEMMYDIISSSTIQNGFRSGMGAIMDVHTGEIIALSSFPSFDPEVLADGDDVAQIRAYTEDNRFPFLNKVVGGLYTPGSVMKPFVAYGALAEGVITPGTVIVSRGSITIPNPYNPSNPAIFRDWRESLGAMTVADALAYSSNVFLMTIGGGHGDIRGLGITKLDSYFELFGFGSETGIALAGEKRGTVPTPAWKQEVFDDEWRLGDTYLTSIGQFGFQATPLQVLRAYAALANGGALVTPHIVKDAKGEQQSLQLDPEHLATVQDGLRKTVIQDGGTARALERDDVAIAAKSGTAELGESKAHVNSWIAGYFPYEQPRYAFVLLMEYGPRTNMVGAGSVMGRVFDWMGEHRSEYFEVGN